MRIMTWLVAGSTLLTGSAPLVAQTRVTVAPRAFTLLGEDENRAALGITTGSSGKRDTLGLLVESVTQGSPAEKAGLEEGDRIVSIDGVNLRLSPEDAGEADMEGIATRRLVRALEKHKAGDAVQLRVWRDGRPRDLTVETVALKDLNTATTRFSSVLSTARDRVVLGLSLGGSGSRRDTLGVLVVGVTRDGPAAKAGIDEGDRIASINGVDLRVAREDAGDQTVSSIHIRRFTREMGKVKAGDEVALQVWNDGRMRTVRVRAAKASDLPHEAGSFFYVDPGSAIDGIRARIAPAAPMARILREEALRSRIDVTPRVRVRTRQRLDSLRRSIEEIRARALTARRISIGG